MFNLREKSFCITDKSAPRNPDTTKIIVEKKNKNREWSHKLKSSNAIISDSIYGFLTYFARKLSFKDSPQKHITTLTFILRNVEAQMSQLLDIQTVIINLEFYWISTRIYHIIEKKAIFRVSVYAY